MLRIPLCILLAGGALLVSPAAAQAKGAAAQQAMTMAGPARSSLALGLRRNDAKSIAHRGRKKEPH
jgi:hypothetical protein